MPASDLLTDSASRKLDANLNAIVRSELAGRLIPDGADAPRLAPVIEALEGHNRRLVRLHQEGDILPHLPELFLTFLRLQEGGRLHLPRPSVHMTHHDAYLSAAERFDTLFTSALMSLPDQRPADIVRRHMALFREKHDQIRFLLTQLAAAESLRRRVHAVVPESPGIADKAAAFLLETVGPLELAIERHREYCAAHEADPYLSGAVSRLAQTLDAARWELSAKARNAVGFLFEAAERLFQEFKSTPVDLSHLDRFLAQREELNLLADLFHSALHPNREARIRDMIQTMDGAIDALFREIDRGKAKEARYLERRETEIADAHERFLEIRGNFSHGLLPPGRPREKAARELRTVHALLSSHQRKDLAGEVERFMLSTGIGANALPAPSSPASPRPTAHPLLRKFLLASLGLNVLLAFLLFALISFLR